MGWRTGPFSREINSVKVKSGRTESQEARPLKSCDWLIALVTWKMFSFCLLFFIAECVRCTCCCCCCVEFDQVEWSAR